MSTELAIAGLTIAADRHAYPLERAMLQGGILEQLEKAHFIAQMAHETQGFTAFEENLNYRAERLLVVFKKYFTPEQAKAYAHKPVKIGSRVYANRYGNGSEASGDGYRYRGRGYVHLTFRDNYRDASRAMYKDDRLVQNPDLASSPHTAAEIAVWYWNSRNCSPLARIDNCEAVTRRINGGINGLEDREAWLVRTKKAFKV